MPPHYDEIVEVRKHLKELTYEHWVHDDFMSGGWWMLLAAAVLPWILWWRYFAERRRIFELMTYALLWGVSATIFDVWGTSKVLWGYPDKLTPAMPPLLPADLSVIPVTFTCIYQFTYSWTPYMAGTLLLSGIFSYVVEPLFIRADLFALFDWSHTFSFIGFFLLSIMIRYLVMRMMNMASRR